MNNANLVSIIMPSFNSESYIHKTIDSIIAQTYTEWELLITDDCSSDATANILREYAEKDSRIKFQVLSQNMGAGEARNNSISMATGRYIAFCDSDDIWHKNKLEAQVSFMKETGIALSYSRYLKRDTATGHTTLVKTPLRLTLHDMLRCNYIGCLTAIYDTEKVGKIYMPTIRKRQDWGLWLLILKKCGVSAGIEEPLCTYSVRRGGISRKKMGLISYNIKIYQTTMGWSKTKAVLFFLFVFIPSQITKKLLKQ